MYILRYAMVEEARRNDLEEKARYQHLIKQCPSRVPSRPPVLYRLGGLLVKWGQRLQAQMAPGGALESHPQRLVDNLS